MPAKRTSNRCEIAIRPATSNDTDFILSLVPRFVSVALPNGRHKRKVAAQLRADIARSLRDHVIGQEHFIAIDARHRPVGFLRVRIESDFFSGERACHVSDIVVAKGHEGHGIGRALLAYAQRRARAHRCTLMTLNLFPGNVRARDLYQRAGYAPDLVRMAKPLASHPAKRST